MADDTAPSPEVGVAPYLVAMLVCDQVISEAVTNKKSLIGLFDTVRWPQKPISFTVSIYAKLTDAAGRYRFAIDFVQVATGKRLAGGSLKDIEIQDRLGFADLVIRVPIVIPEPGQYEFRLYANDGYIGRAVFTAVAAESVGE